MSWVSPSVTRTRGCIRWCAPALLVAAGCTSDDPAGTAWFSEEAKVRGLDFTHESGFSSQPLLPEIVGGGVALADVDGDDDLDIYLVQSGWSLAQGPSDEAPADRLYLNRGDGRFDEARNAGGHRGYGMGVAVGDYDNDGDVDLYVTNVGANALLRNDGRGRFEDVAAAAGVDDPGWGTAAAFLDLDADDDLDLFVVNYMNWSPAIEPGCESRGEPTYCSPVAYKAAAPDRLFRNNGDGTFTNVTLEAGLNVAYGNGLGIVGADFNGDGRLDVFVANDKMLNQLWLNQGGLRFAEQAMHWGCAADDSGTAKAGMGVAARDVDDDGDPDLLVVNLEGETDSFFRNESTYFVDATASVKLGASSSRSHTRFGAALADFDNDGLLDLYVANGKVDGNPNARDDAFAEPNLLFRGLRQGGFAFHEVAPTGGVSPSLRHTSRGTAVGDLNGDGALDMVVVNRHAPAYLLINQAPSRGGAVRFRVRSRNGRDAYGAVVSATAGTTRTHRQVQPASSYLASHEPHVHFGIGEHQTVADVTVRWPDGTEEHFGEFPVGALAELREGQGLAAEAALAS